MGTPKPLRPSLVGEGGGSSRYSPSRRVRVRAHDSARRAGCALRPRQRAEAWLRRLSSTEAWAAPARGSASPRPPGPPCRRPRGRPDRWQRVGGRGSGRPIRSRLDPRVAHVEQRRLPLRLHGGINRFVEGPVSSSQVASFGRVAISGIPHAARIIKSSIRPRAGASGHQSSVADSA